jgi:hypothetical protein
VELADVGEMLAPRPGGADALEVGGEAVRLADERDALAFLRETAGLFHSEERLAAARAVTNLNAMDETNASRMTA